MTELPTELIDQVVNLVGHDPIQLQHCAQVSRSFASITRRLVFRKVVLSKNFESNKGKVGSPSGFSELLQRSPQLAIYVKDLELTIPAAEDPSISRVLAALKNVVVFTFSGPIDLKDVHAQFVKNIFHHVHINFRGALEDFFSNRQITHIHLEELYGFPPELLRQCSYLTSLQLRKVLFMDDFMQARKEIAHPAPAQHLYLTEFALEGRWPETHIQHCTSRLIGDHLGHLDMTHLKTLSIEIWDNLDAERLQQFFDAPASALQLESIFVTPMQHSIVLDATHFSFFTLAPEYTIDFSRVRNLVHLSVDFPNVSMAQMVVWLIQHLRYFTSSSRSTSDTGTLQSLTIKIHIYCIDHMHSPPWSDLDDILCRPYFKRLNHFSLTIMGAATAGPIVNSMPIDLPRLAPKVVKTYYREEPVRSSKFGGGTYDVAFTYICDILSPC